jgi:endonuclease VIII
MPEGDTILRTARALDRALTGRAVIRFEAPRLIGRRPRPGATVTGVEARGKHLLIHFDDRLSLHTHMRMNGSWHLYRPGAPWRKSPGAARVVIEVDSAVAVCFSAPVVEVVSEPDRHPALAALGPDLAREGADIDDAVARMGRLPPATEVADALLDQRVACGVGNVYKSEVLFACGVDPTTPVAELPLARRRQLLDTAARLLRANLDGWPRTTITSRTPHAPGNGGLAVYGRAGRPCRRCGNQVRSRRRGDGARVTYWCPVCQPATSAPASHIRPPC